MGEAFSIYGAQLLSLVPVPSAHCPVPAFSVPANQPRKRKAPIWGTDDGEVVDGLRASAVVPAFCGT